MIMRGFVFGAVAPLVLLTGCFGIGGYWVPPPSPPDPFLSHWIKNDMTKESRRNDSWACGALPTTYAADHAMVTEGANQGGEIDLHLSRQWVVCMKAKGYVHLEKCDARCLYP